MDAGSQAICVWLASTSTHSCTAQCRSISAIFIFCYIQLIVSQSCYQASSPQFSLITCVAKPKRPCISQGQLSHFSTYSIRSTRLPTRLNPVALVSSCSFQILRPLAFLPSGSTRMRLAPVLLSLISWQTAPKRRNARTRHQLCALGNTS
ncbi:hypothetical protein HDK77DRAFT_28719 [Phyllosticta capitalensis]|uniref:Uncharacterized protein n=1 Tax=Phyllosticta capitalensis TaxID=121624 RepID=A0ABR1Z060_9PEZI